MEKFVEALIGYAFVAFIGVIIGITFESLLGQWSYAASSILSLGFAKSACGWEFK